MTGMETSRKQTPEAEGGWKSVLEMLWVHPELGARPAVVYTGCSCPTHPVGDLAVCKKRPPPLSSQLTFDLPTPWRISPEVPCGNRKTKTDSSVLAQSLWGAVGRCGALMALQCSLGLAPAAHHPCIHRGNKIAGRVPPAVLAAEENTFHVFMQ